MRLGSIHYLTPVPKTSIRRFVLFGFILVVGDFDFVEHVPAAFDVRNQNQVKAVLDRRVQLEKVRHY